MGDSSARSPSPARSDGVLRRRPCARTDPARGIICGRRETRAKHSAQGRALSPQSARVHPRMEATQLDPHASPTCASRCPVRVHVRGRKVRTRHSRTAQARSTSSLPAQPRRAHRTCCHAAAAAVCRAPAGPHTHGQVQTRQWRTQNFKIGCAEISKD